LSLSPFYFFFVVYYCIVLLYCINNNNNNIAYTTSRHCGHVMYISSPIITATCVVDISIDWPQAGLTSLK